jgi:PEP-CTERM motif
MTRILIAAAILLMQGQSAKASLLWNWSYSGPGVSASGTFTTNDAPDAAGFYQIDGITGTDNGATITGLQPTGTPISGNEPFAVDNLVSAVEPRLTTHGFGFSLANGDYANPFYNGSNYYEYLSVPPYVKGAGAERPVSFSAAIVPEPSAASLMLVGLAGLTGFARILNRRTNLNQYSLHRLAGSKGLPSKNAASFFPHTELKART